MKKCALIVSALLLLTAGCSSPPTVHRLDAELDRNATAAKNAYASGSMANAELFYQKALDRARLTDQPAEIARMAYNLAACRAQMQKYDEALMLLNEAQSECNAAGLDFQEIKLLRAEIDRSLGQTNEAFAIASSGIDTLKNRKNDFCRLQFQLFFSELACDRNDGALALKELDKIDRRLLASSAPIIQAKAAGVRGRALLLEKRPAEAAICFDNAAALYQKAQRYSDMAVALQSAGDAYEAGGKRQEAINRHYRAARSFFLGGENTKAQESLNKTLKLAN